MMVENDAEQDSIISHESLVNGPLTTAHLVLALYGFLEPSNHEEKINQTHKNLINDNRSGES